MVKYWVCKHGGRDGSDCGGCDNSDWCDDCKWWLVKVMAKIWPLTTVVVENSG